MITLPMFARQITLRDFATRPNSFTTIVLQALGSLFQLCSLYNQALTASSCETPGVSAPRRWARSRAKLPSPLFLITCLPLSRFQRVPHSFVQRSASYSRVFNGLRTLLTSTGVAGGVAKLGTSRFRSEAWGKSQWTFVAGLLPPWRFASLAPHRKHSEGTRSAPRRYAPHPPPPKLRVHKSDSSRR